MIESAVVNHILSGESPFLLRIQASCCGTLPITAEYMFTILCSITSHYVLSPCTPALLPWENNVALAPSFRAKINIVLILKV